VSPWRIIGGTGREGPRGPSGKGGTSFRGMVGCDVKGPGIASQRPATPHPRCPPRDPGSRRRNPRVAARLRSHGGSVAVETGPGTKVCPRRVRRPRRWTGPDGRKGQREAPSLIARGLFPSNSTFGLQSARRGNSSHRMHAYVHARILHARLRAWPESLHASRRAHGALDRGDVGHGSALRERPRAERGRGSPRCARAGAGS